ALYATSAPAWVRVRHSIARLPLVVPLFPYTTLFRSDKGRTAVIDWCLHARKLGWDIIFIVQNISIVDKQARLALGEHLVICRRLDRKSTRLNSSHVKNSYAVFCLKKKNH